MSDEPAWVWQGFFGPMSTATAARAALIGDPRIGVMIPLDDGPVAVDVEGTMGMFAIQTRPADPVATPAGLMQAQPSMVGRLVNA